MILFSLVFIDLFVLISIIIVFDLSVLLEWIYSMNSNPDSFILLTSVNYVQSPIKDILVGKALGDVSVTTGKKGVGFKIEHSINQKDYVVHLWNI
jgi:hypothetical protein